MICMVVIIVSLYFFHLLWFYTYLIKCSSNVILKIAFKRFLTIFVAVFTYFLSKVTREGKNKFVETFKTNDLRKGLVFYLKQPKKTQFISCLDLWVTLPNFERFFWFLNTMCFKVLTLICLRVNNKYWPLKQPWNHYDSTYRFTFFAKVWYVVGYHLNPFRSE